MTKTLLPLRRSGADEHASTGGDQLSRRRFLGCSASSAAMLSLLPVSAEAQETLLTEVGYNRMNKVASHYQNHPNGTQHCAICRHFQPPHACEIVTGRIS